MDNRDDARHELQRLQRALDALASDVDAIQRRPRWSYSNDEQFDRIENAIGHFAFAVKSGNVRLV